MPQLLKEIDSPGDPPTGISDRVVLERIGPILSDLYGNGTDKCGIWDYDPVLKVKILLLQKGYNPSGPQIWMAIRSCFTGSR
ncbi:MAG: hypothetical protein QXU18_09945 [Thermoplasmatales archaeon]